MYKSIGIVLSGLLAITSAGVRAGDIGVAEAWIREAPPHAAALAGYLSLSNASAVPVTLESISSADFGGSPDIAFDGFGTPASGGTVTVHRNGYSRQVVLDADTGRARVP